jgi:enediyne biosynthesis protein E5
VTSTERDLRLPALRRFAVAITVLNAFGHTVLGFEQSWAQPLAALATAYAMETLLELVDARVNRRALRFAGGWRAMVDFLLSAHITALAVSMLLYANERIWPIVFATAVATGSKHIFRVRVGGSTRHVLNPSNFGITMALLAFPWVGIAPPYQFTENVSGALDWIVPGLIVVSGTVLNWRFTAKLPLIGAWLGGFAAQALVRHLLFDTALVAAWLPMTGLAFLLYTFYMVTDPATTPASPRGQVAFGLSVAAVYGLLMVSHVVFGLFFALTIVCSVRGLGLWAAAVMADRARAKVPLPTSVVTAGPER